MATKQLTGNVEKYRGRGISLGRNSRGHYRASTAPIQGQWYHGPNFSGKGSRQAALADARKWIDNALNDPCGDEDATYPIKH